ncbi:hypothetical protein BDY24DRAFT_436670 [Mrakia frigida]|uniref:uncharacterized protein n=1 Tax=Mrakia frigida TaxID=29902 RepID=UPI003FCBF414
MSMYGHFNPLPTHSTNFPNPTTSYAASSSSRTSSTQPNNDASSSFSPPQIDPSLLCPGFFVHPEIRQLSQQLQDSQSLVIQLQSMAGQAASSQMKLSWFEGRYGSYESLVQLPHVPTLPSSSGSSAPHRRTLKRSTQLDHVFPLPDPETIQLYRDEYGDFQTRIPVDEFGRAKALPSWEPQSTSGRSRSTALQHLDKTTATPEEIASAKSYAKSISDDLLDRNLTFGKQPSATMDLAVKAMSSLVPLSIYGENFHKQKLFLSKHFAEARRPPRTVKDEPSDGEMLPPPSKKKRVLKQPAMSEKKKGKQRMVKETSDDEESDGDGGKTGQHLTNLDDDDEEEEVSFFDSATTVLPTETNDSDEERDASPFNDRSSNANRPPSTSQRPPSTASSSSRLSPSVSASASTSARRTSTSKPVGANHGTLTTSNGLAGFVLPPNLLEKVTPSLHRPPADQPTGKSQKKKGKKSKETAAVPEGAVGESAGGGEGSETATTKSGRTRSVSDKDRLHWANEPEDVQQVCESLWVQYDQPGLKAYGHNTFGITVTSKKVGVVNIARRLVDASKVTAASSSNAGESV